MALLRRDASEECILSIIKVETISELVASYCFVPSFLILFTLMMEVMLSSETRFLQ
jgi:hypothetical protein